MSDTDFPSHKALTKTDDRQASDTSSELITGSNTCRDIYTTFICEPKQLRYAGKANCACTIALAIRLS